MKLMVSSEKIPERARALLASIFRVRRCRQHCHHNIEMRLISLDQKPCWFNNAGHKGTLSRKGRGQL